MTTTTPSFSEFFKSSYYSNHYASSIDLSEQAIAGHLLTAGKEKTADKVHELISKPDMQQELAENGVIERAGWTIKLEAVRESLLRIGMTQRVAKAAQAAGIDALTPQMSLAAYIPEGGTKADQKYCVVNKEMTVLSAKETIEAIRGMSEEEQKKLAQQIGAIIQKSGLSEASFENIRLTSEGKLAFLDTVPANLMVVKKMGLWNRVFGPKGESVEKCARAGLSSLKSHASDLKAFSEQVASDYEKVLAPKLSKWKIVLSVASLGLVPLIKAIAALVKVRQDAVRQNNEAMASIISDHKQLKECLADLKAKYEIAEDSHISTMRQNDAIMAQVRREYKQLKANFENLQSKYEIAEDHISTMYDMMLQLTALEKDVQNSKSMVVEFNDRIEEIKKTVPSINIADLKYTVDKLNKRIRELEVSTIEISTNIKDSKLTGKALNKRFVEIENNVERNEQSIRVIGNSIDDLDEKLVMLEIKYDDYEEEIPEKQTEISEEAKRELDETLEILQEDPA